HRMVPLLNQLGVETCWDVIKGGQRFFEVTKKFHNVLHGQAAPVTLDDFEEFLETSRANAAELAFTGDILVVHDPQPIALVHRKRRQDRRWIWRCHIDVSNPNERVWRFLRRFIDRYDASIFSAPSFARRLPIRQFLVSPSIDPLSDKNRELEPAIIDSVLQRLQIPRDRPLITQVSRFDRLKDPLGVIDAFLLVRKSFQCRLVLAGGGASDDPEGASVLADVRAKAQGRDDIHVLDLPPGSDIEINALQRSSTIIVQKSVKEGFGLTVAEALWKARPVVASAVGGIPLQVIHRHGGLLCHSVEGAALAIKQLLANPAYARGLGENGREHVRQHFLLTRHLKEYLLLFLALDHAEEIVALG
ncbi:MAG: glycosyltransferase, partial [Candidatus Omnitrophica bacterium]|nr:glycosyltransferase [Candidatus Omnitrophota bacterium]